MSTTLSMGLRILTLCELLLLLTSCDPVQRGVVPERTGAVETNTTRPARCAHLYDPYNVNDDPRSPWKLCMGVGPK